jgi:Flp pilus assembly protein TadG
MSFALLPILRRTPDRRGAIAVLVAVMIPVLLVLTAFAVNVSYMQMVREQLRVTCDASAKAALVNFGATQQQSSAIALAQSLANQNLVAGQTLPINSSNLLFGNATKGTSGVYAFSAGGSPLNSVQLTGTISAPLLMPTFLPIKSFVPNQVSFVTRVSHDICLVLDRSASMAFDLSVNEFTYPADVAAGRNPLQCYFVAPSPTASRWVSLTQAVNSFVSVLQARNLDVHLALATYAEAFTFGTYSATEASLDVQLTNNFNSTVTAMNNYGQNPLLGDTNIAAGLALAQSELTGPRARTTANRTIILLTDGVATTGNTDIPGIALSYRQTNNIVMHTITFSAEAGTSAAQAAMQGAATNGNGMYFYAPTSAQLQTAFQTIADSLPAVLVQ